MCKNIKPRLGALKSGEEQEFEISFEKHVDEIQKVLIMIKTKSKPIMEEFTQNDENGIKYCRKLITVPVDAEIASIGLVLNNSVKATLLTYKRSHKIKTFQLSTLKLDDVNGL